ncbi:hypothetical protein BN903_71 [Halorubrum sp. AJ67]|nr:hypothetical protein BN903_71 [Halorubrum sp. AJ67]
MRPPRDWGFSGLDDRHCAKTSYVQPSDWGFSDRYVVNG